MKKINDLFDGLVPQQGWLGDWLKSTEETSESSTSLHFFSAATVLGAVLGRKVWVKEKHREIYPNLPTVLVSPFEIHRQAPASRIALSDLLDMNGELKSPQLPFFIGTVTPRRIVDYLKSLDGDGVGLFEQSEIFWTFKSKRGGGQLLKFLGILLDSPDRYVHQLKTGETITLHNVTLSMLLNATPSQLAVKKGSKKDLLNRLLLIVQTDRTRIYPCPPDPSEEMRLELANRLNKFTEIEGEFHWNPASKGWYEDWSGAFSVTAPMAGESEETLARQPEWLLKLAMIMQIAQDGSTEFDYSVLEQAHCILREIKRRRVAAAL